MVHIFHGDDQQGSRAAFNQYLDSQSTADILRLDQKEINLDLISGFLNGPSLFPGQKIIAFSNFFTISKPILEKVIKMIDSNSGNYHLVIWQDKLLNTTQLKTLPTGRHGFPQAQIKSFSRNNPIWGCLNNLQPYNSKKFFPIFHDVTKDNYDLFLYLVKGQIRKQLISTSRFSATSLKRAYLHLTELDSANKTGQLSIPAPIALERILLELMEY